VENLFERLPQKKYHFPGGGKAVAYEMWRKSEMLAWSGKDDIACGTD